MTAYGKWFITPHAVRRYIERVEPSLSYEQALARLIQLSETARYVKDRDGYELWRGPRPLRVTCRVLRGNGGLPHLVTVTRGPEPGWRP